MPDAAVNGTNGSQDEALVLSTRDLVSGYGGVPVLKGLTFDVGQEVFTILGANGAGKTTLLATLARLIPIMEGTIDVRGTDVTASPAHHAARLGVGYVPQEGAIFPDLTVMENLSVGGMVGNRPFDERLDEVFTTFPDLRTKTGLLAGNLSGGESRMVACGRALMQDPHVLLLDEPTAGLSPLYVELFFEKIAEIHAERNVAIVLTEQNATLALGVADRVMVLTLGEGSDPVPAAEVTTDRLKEAYKL
ncbi:MAG: ABC transporter ATP-binding protein [Actinomycetota bacterium]